MNLKTIKYSDYKTSIPTTGKYIIAQQTETEILVYQAFNKQIADYAMENQKFGGEHYSFSRMSWIKTNFLWMMYRCGWATKENQQRVLGIWLSKDNFDLILASSTHTSFQNDIYANHDQWKKTLKTHPVRLQWDPDHGLKGENLARKAIQLGLKGELLRQFTNNMVLEIIDVTDFVKEQRLKIETNQKEEVLVPFERIYKPKNDKILLQLGL